MRRLIWLYTVDVPQKGRYAYMGLCNYSGCFKSEYVREMQQSQTVDQPKAL